MVAALWYALCLFGQTTARPPTSRQPWDWLAWEQNEIIDICDVHMLFW